VHLSGHTVERGVVTTGSVRVGAGATIGLGSVVDIGAEIGPGCVVGALSLVPKFATLSAGAVYAGIPVRRLPADAHASDAPRSIARPPRG
jgi:carbonic anhydrase/acetyltransferase-like protein (isoleucine patch superfamily)